MVQTLSFRVGITNVAWFVIELQIRVPDQSDMV